MIVGLTGGIGSGKTTVSDKFLKLGIHVVDADIVAREVVEPGTSALNHIVQHFGSNILTKSGELNRTNLREIVFANPDEKAWLNALLHPLIRQEMFSQLHQASSPYSILVAPLLIENKLDKLVDRVLVIDVSKSTQIQRTCQRDGSSIEIVENIISSQVDRQGRLAAADDTIDNDNVSIDSLDEQINKLHLHYLSLAKSS